MVITMPINMSQGLNELVAADTNIFYSNSYSQETRSQAQARSNRLGQTSDFINHIDLCSPDMIDYEIVTALQGKNLTSARLDTIVNKYAGACPYE